MANLKYIGKNILNHDLILKKGDISGSSSSTGSFGRIDVADNISADSFTGTFDGALSSYAQIASDISGSFGADSASFSTRVTNLKTDIGWGHQIRSYVLQPYQLVKDLRNKTESTNQTAVLNGELDDFIESGVTNT